MGNKLLTQIILIITSVVIVLTYIKPAFTEISDIQDDIARYENTVSKAADLNSALQELVATERSISSQESRNLDLYLPTDVSDVRVMRDIQNIFKLANVPLSALTSAASESFQSQIESIGGETRDDLGESSPNVVFRDFQMSFFGTYEHLKLIMQGLEINAYPLEVVELSFASAQDPDEASSDYGLPPGVVQYGLTLRAFALPSAE